MPSRQPGPCLKMPEKVAPGEPVAHRGPACAGRVSGAGGGAPGWRVAVRGLGASRTAPVRPPRRPVQHGAPCSWLALSGLVWAGHGPCFIPPWLGQTAPQPGRGKARARPSLEDLVPPFPPPGGLVGLRPAIEAIPGARPGCCVRRCVGALPPPVAKLRSCVASLRSLRRRPPPSLLSPRPRLPVPLPAGIQS